jgi:thiol-disulfide isomerase/thioredoxin
MNKKILTLALVGSAAIALGGVAAIAQADSNAAPAASSSKVDPFVLVGQDSHSYELRYYKDSKAIVIVSQTDGSPLIRAAAPALNALQAKYEAQGVKFFMLNSTGNKEAAVAGETQSLGLNMPVLLDDAQLVGENLNISKVAQAVVINPANWQVVYRGPIDDRFAAAVAKPDAPVKSAYVANALDSLIAGKSVAVASADLSTPAIAFPARAHSADFTKISYAKEIAPILAEKCVACHTQGGIAPFAMDSYEKVKGFSPMIRETIRTDRMPPYNADPHVGTFRDDQNLSVADQKTLVHWIEAGAPRGDGPDPLKVNAKAAPEWDLGQPDLILNVPAYTIPASGVVDYQNPVVYNPLKQDRWIKAITFNVGSRAGVHHITGSLASYAVGAQTVTFPEGQGMKLEAGQRVRLSMHYTPFGKEVVDNTRIGLYFFPDDKPPEKIRQTLVIANADIEIPAGDPKYQAVAYATIAHDATVYSILPHAHYRGESAQVYMQKPGQKEELIISLPKYNFNWQRGYYFKTPIDAPAGTKFITRTTYDNSTKNMANPDPKKTVTWGEMSWEEMQYTEVSIAWKDETTKNQKPQYMAEFAATRGIGILDSNMDGKIQKAELKGPIGRMVQARFDQFDTNHDGVIDANEAKALTPFLNNRVQVAEKALETAEVAPPTAQK